MRTCGFSDKMFYYNGSGNETNNMRMRFELSIPLTREMLEEAARKTFALFPEYMVRPVVKGSTILYEENTQPIPVFFEEKEQGRCYGSDELNGYLFAVSGDAHSFTFTQYHGLTDFVGYWSIVHTLIRNLMAEAGILAEDPLARTDTSLYDSLEKGEREDPYSKYADENAEVPWMYHSNGAFVLPEKVTPNVRYFDFFVSEAAFLEKTKEYKTSFVPLLIMLISRAIERVYGIGEHPVVVKIPVNMRPLFGTNTTVNFSDSAVLEYPREYLTLPESKQGQELRAMLKAQMNPGYFARVMAKKIQTIRGYEEGGKSIQEINQLIRGSSSSGSRPVTMGLTYPGRLTFPEAYQEKIIDITPCAYMPTDGIYLTCLASRGRLRIRIQSKLEGTAFVDAMGESLRELGFETELNEVFLDIRDICDISKLKKLSE